MTTRVLASGVAVALSFVALTASAQSMNPALERLVLDPNCRTAVGELARDYNGVCQRDDVAFKQLVSQLAFAMAPTGFHPARTVGLGGFELAIEASFTRIDDGASYWQRGTRGPESNVETASVRNAEPSSVLSTWSLRARKGLGFGFELAAQFGFLPGTTILYGGGDVRWAIFEGFRNGAWRYVPDLAVGGGVRTTSGSPQINMTVASVDVQLSKPFPVAENSVLSPWLGYQYNWVFGNSGLIDLTPATDALGFCNYGGRAQPGGPTVLPDGAEPDTGGAYSGQPTCQTGEAGGERDFRNNVVFDEARLERQRLLIGLGYQYEFLNFGVQFITDVVPPADAQVGDGNTNSSSVPTRTGPDGTVAESRTVSDSEILEGVAGQWTIVLQAGVIF